MKIEKLLNQLPETLEPNTIYLIKNNDRITTYLTDNTAAPQIYKFKNDDVCVYGPVSINVNESDAYYITNFDSRITYDITPIDGTIDSLSSDGVIIYTAPSTPGPSGFIINGKQYNITITLLDINYAPSFKVMSYGIMRLSNSIDDPNSYEYPYDTIIDNSNNVLTIGSYEINNDNYNDSVSIYKLNSNLLKDVTFNSSGNTPGLLRITDTGQKKYLSRFLKKLSTGECLLIFTYRDYGNNGIYNTLSYIINPDGSYNTAIDFDLLFTSIENNLQLEANKTYISNISILNNDDMILYCFNNYNGYFYFYTIKINKLGTLDTTFGNNGIITNLSSDIIVNPFAYLEMSNNKIISITTSNNVVFNIIRLNINGSIDTTFGNNGIVSHSNLLRLSGGKYLQSNDKIILTGKTLDNRFSSIVRLNIDGSLDAQHNTNITGVYRYCIELQNNKIIAVGSYYDEITYQEKALASRFNSDLTLDTSFGNNGHFIKSVDYWTYVDAVNELPGNTILLTCDTWNLDWTKGNIVYIKLDNNGMLDTSFNLTPGSSIDNIILFDGVTPVTISPNITISDSDLDAFNNGVGNYNQAVISLTRANNIINNNDRFLLSGDFEYTTDLTNHIRKISTNQIVATCYNTIVFNNTLEHDPDAYSVGTIYIKFENNTTTAIVNELAKSIKYFSNTTDSVNFQLQWIINDSNGNNLQGVGGALQDNGIVNIYLYPDVLTTTYCVGQAKWGTYSDGYGGTYDAIIDNQSIDCGYIPHVNLSPIISIKSPINYFPNETIILDSNATIVDPELTLLSGTDSLSNTHSGMYNGLSINIRRTITPNNNDMFSLYNDINKSSMFAGSSIIQCELPGIPNWSIGTVNTGLISVDGLWKWIAVSQLTANMSNGSYQEQLNHFIQSLTYRHEGDGPNTIDLELTVSDGNTGTQGSGGVGTTVKNITLVKPLVITYDEFDDTTGTNIENHSPIIGGQWLLHRKIHNPTYTANPYPYFINNNKLNNRIYGSNETIAHHKLISNTSSLDALIAYNTEIRLSFSLTNSYNWVYVIIYGYHRFDIGNFSCVFYEMKIYSNGNYELKIKPRHLNGGANTKTGNLINDYPNLTNPILGQQTIVSRLIDNNFIMYYGDPSNSQNSILLKDVMFGEYTSNAAPILPGKQGFAVFCRVPVDSGTDITGDGIIVESFKVSKLVNNKDIYMYDSFTNDFNVLQKVNLSTHLTDYDKINGPSLWETGNWNNIEYLEINDNNEYGALSIAEYSPGDTVGVDTIYSSANNKIIEAIYSKKIPFVNFYIEIVFGFNISRDNGSFIGIIGRHQRDVNNNYTGDCVNINLWPGTKYGGSSVLNLSTYGNGLLNDNPVQFDTGTYGDLYLNKLRVEFEGLIARCYSYNSINETGSLITTINLDPSVGNAGHVGFMINNISLSGRHVAITLLDFKVGEL